MNVVLQEMGLLQVSWDARAKYQRSVKWTQRHQNNIKKKNMAESQLTILRDLWSEVRKASSIHNVSVKVIDDLYGAEEISNYFASKYEDLYSSHIVKIPEGGQITILLSGAIRDWQLDKTGVCLRQQTVSGSNPDIKLSQTGACFRQQTSSDSKLSQTANFLRQQSAPETTNSLSQQNTSDSTLSDSKLSQTANFLRQQTLSDSKLSQTANCLSQDTSSDNKLPHRGNCLSQQTASVRKRQGKANWSQISVAGLLLQFLVVSVLIHSTVVFIV